MAADPVAWFIGDGAVHSPEIARMVLHSATKGGNGIIQPNDLKVEALAVPGTKVRVALGSFVAVSRFANVTSQSYGGRFVSETEVPVTATGGTGGRSDMLVARVKDPQYLPFSANPPADRAVGPYVELFMVEGVSPTAETALELNLGYPAVELARLDIPLNTATIIPAHIKPLRKLCDPHTWTDSSSPAVSTKVLSTQAYMRIPDLGVETYVPRWATEALVRITLAGISTQPGQIQEGILRAKLGGVVAKTVAFSYDNPTTRNLRETMVVSGTIDVRSMQGTKRLLELDGSKDPNFPGSIGVDSKTNAIYEVVYSERVS